MSVDIAPRRPDAEAVRAQAASWLLRRRDFDVWTEAEQQALDAWLNISLAHRIAYLRLEAVWQDADRLTILRPRFEGRVGKTLRNIGPKLGRLTALFAVSLIIGGGAYFFISPTVERTYSTTIGERKVVTLTDGSRIELNTDTSLRISTDSRGRHVSLVKGEAFFKIAHNTAIPFVVDAGNYRVVDLGTQFAVRRDGAKLNVDLVEGSARFESSEGSEAKARSIVLVPGDTIVATADSLSVKRKSADSLADLLGWRRGMLVFHHAPLAEVVTEYNRYNTQKMTISDPSIAQRTITATLPTNNIEAFARIATNFFGLHVTQRGNEVTISR
jgi:transmembrane sensor